MARRRRQPTAEDQHRATMVRRVAEILDDPDAPSRFTHEGACRAGLRAAFCLRGATWDQADAFAAAIVAEALRSIGARRPLWHEGQPEWAQDGVLIEERTTCAWCESVLEERDQTLGGRARKFCSDSCRSGYFSWKRRTIFFQMSLAERRAISATEREHYQLRTATVCHHCGALFNPGRAHERKFCSAKCKYASQAEAQRRWPKRRCRQCRKTFRSRGEDNVYCSRACIDAARAPKPIACEHCGTEFKPSSGNPNRYCSQECHYEAKRKPVPDRQCPQCLSIFRTRDRTSTQRFCSRTCGARYRSGYEPAIKEFRNARADEETADPPPIMLAAE